MKFLCFILLLAINIASGLICDNSVVPKTPDCDDDKSVFCQLSTINTLCQYCGVDLTACGSSVCSRELSQEEKDYILDKHNELRSKVAKGLEERGANGSGPQPKAADMFKLVWDPVLERMAQRWADQCQEFRDKDHRIPGFSLVGLNFGHVWTDTVVEDRAIDDILMDWYDEVANWPSQNVGNYSMEGKTGKVIHYGQMAWGPTTRLGCGYISFLDVKKPDTPFRRTLICNYAVGLDYFVPMYTSTEGEPGVECPNGAEQGLCI